MTGGLNASPILITGSGITLAFVLLATVYMWGPALANVLTRLITHEGWAHLYIKPNIKNNWSFWLMGWFLPPLLIILGSALFFIIFPGYFDASMTVFKTQLSLTTMDIEGLNLPQVIMMQALVAILISPIANAVSTFGEEFGWRAYLLPKLEQSGAPQALLLQGAIWGIWHWPIIAMGYNYGSNYFGAPWLGMLAMLWFTMAFGVLLGWLTMRSKSIWPAVIAHGSLNGLAAISAYFMKGNPPLLLGPFPVGVIASAPFAILAAYILLQTYITDKKQENIKLISHN